MIDYPAITGLGLITILGDSPQATWDAIIHGSRRATDHTRLTLSAEYGSRVATAGALAAQQAVAQAGWSRDALRDDRTALVVGTSKGEIEDWISPPPAQSPIILPPTVGRLQPWGLGRIAHRIGAASGLGTGPAITLSAACASGLHALIRACLMLRTGEADRVLVVAAEASVHPLFISSFQRLGVLAPPGHGCRPFDETRAGFLMTEAAAAVCLERNSTAKPLAYVAAYAMGGDAAHLTSNDASGATLRRMLGQVIGDDSIDLIHAHGTGTVVNDPIELTAIDAILPPAGLAVPVVSHKAHLGHSLGAAGLVAVALNCLSHQLGLIPGNPQTTRPIASDQCLIASKPSQQQVRRSICLAAGFGGSIAAVKLTSRSR